MRIGDRHDTQPSDVDRDGPVGGQEPVHRRLDDRVRRGDEHAESLRTLDADRHAIERRAAIPPSIVTIVPVV